MKSWVTPSPVASECHKQRTSTPTSHLAMEDDYPVFDYNTATMHCPSQYEDFQVPPRVRSHSPSYSRSPTQLSRREKEPSRFNGKSDLKDFLDHFKAVSKWNDWGFKEMGLQLAICLCDEAREVLSTLSSEQKHDFDHLVDALTRRFCPDGRESQFSVQLMTRVCQQGEDVTSYGHAIRRLATKAYPGLALDERMLVDMFIKGLPCHEMKRHVYLAKAVTLAEAINAAVTFEAFDGSSGIRKPKPSVNAVAVQPSNEQANSKLTEVIMMLADKLENLQGDISSLKDRNKPRQYQQGRNYSNVECYNCHVKGHISRYCPQNKTGGNSQGGSGFRPNAGKN